MLTKQPRYWFDTEAVREKSLRAGDIPGGNNERGKGEFGVAPHAPFNGEVPANRNVRSVWQIATQPYPEAHFATFPEELARRCILAGCPVRVCRVCGKPSERIVERDYDGSERADDGVRRSDDGVKYNGIDAGFATNPGVGRKRMATDTVGWSDCGCNEGEGSANQNQVRTKAVVEGNAVVVAARPLRAGVQNVAFPTEGGLLPGKRWRPGVVLDPFMGSGTVAKVARDHQRHAIGIDLSETYLELAARRLQQLSLLNEGSA